MIRLPPTVISISIGEVQDYEKRRQKKSIKESLRGTVLQKPSSTIERVDGLSNDTTIDQTFATAPQSPLRSQACSPALLVERIDNLHLQSSPPNDTIKSPEQLFPAWYGMDGHGYDPGEPSNNISPVFEEAPGSLGRRLRQIEIPAPEVELSRRFPRSSAPQSSIGDPDATPRAMPSYTRDLSRRPDTPFRASVSPDTESDFSYGLVAAQNRACSSSQRSYSVDDGADRTPSRVTSPRNLYGKPNAYAGKHRRSFSAHSTPKLRGDALSDENPSSPRFNIYNDALPPEEQPQTPHHLPESRHRSRIVTPFTVPAARGRSRTVDNTPISWRNRSPVGMVEPGFLGLYGGTENGDDLLLFREGERQLGTGPRE